MKNILRLVIAICIVAISLGTGCSERVTSVNAPVIEDGPDHGTKVVVKEKVVPLPQPQRYTLAFVGDIMVHEGQIKAAYRPASKDYSFAGYFSEVKEYLQKPYLTIGNLETTFSGETERYSGYPQFNTPETLADELAEAGFDVLTTANNHSFDRWERGVLSTLDHLHARGLAHTGTYRSAEEASEGGIIGKDGLKSAFLAYTYGTNGLVVPKGKEFLVNRINLEKIKTDIQKVREKGAELVVVSLHFGVEYQRFPGKKEQELVQEVAEAGADIIIGTHPHVLQKIDKLQIQYQNKPKEVLVAYSLGNFVSGYRSRYKDNSIILFVDVLKQPGGEIIVEGYSYLPIWVQRYWHENKTWYRVIPVEKGLNRFNSKDYFLNNEDYRKLQQAWRDTTEMLGLEHLRNVE